MVRAILKGLVAIIAATILILLFAPREGDNARASFDPASIGPDIDAYLADTEAGVPGLRPGTEKAIVWADPEGRGRTPVALVYVHGFSATRGEIAPVPDLVAEALGANLFYTRLAGHGRDGAAMAEARLDDWLDDMAEAMEIGRRLGEEVYLVATSTGAPLAALAAADPALSEGLAGIVMISPNFRLRNPAARILEMPFGRQLGPLLAGAERSFEPQNEAHATFWTHTYPTESLATMAAAMRRANGLDLDAIATPVLFLYAPDDAVVDHGRTEDIAALWGGAVTAVRLTMGPGDDPLAHVIAGDALSPGQTLPVAETITGWIAGQAR